MAIYINDYFKLFGYFDNVDDLMSYDTFIYLDSNYDY